MIYVLPHQPPNTLMATKKTTPTDPLYLDINASRERIDQLEVDVKHLRSALYGDERFQRLYGETMAKGEPWAELWRDQAAGLEKRVEVVEKRVAAHDGALNTHRVLHSVDESMLKRELDSRVDALYRNREADRKDMIWAFGIVAALALGALFVALYALDQL